MAPDPFRDLAVAYQHLTRRPPPWAHHPALCRHGGLDGIVSAVRTDRPDAAESDAAVRALVELGRRDRRASTVLLYALSGELSIRLRRAVTAEYRADALGELAAIILESDTDGTRLGHRYVNRAHNRTSKHHHRIRHHGRIDPCTVDPLPAGIVIDLADRRTGPTDIADLVAARVDLERFGAAVSAAIDGGTLAHETWTTYADHRLAVLYADRQPAPSRQRVAAYRAAKKLQPFIDNHLRGHAA